MDTLPHRSDSGGADAGFLPPPIGRLLLGLCTASILILGSSTAVDAATDRLLAIDRFNPLSEKGSPALTNATSGQFASVAISTLGMNLRPLKADGTVAEPGETVASMPTTAGATNAQGTVEQRLRDGLGGSAYLLFLRREAGTRVETILVNGADGNPTHTNLVRRVTYGKVKRPFPLRMIIHNQESDEENLIRLLQRVFVGLKLEGTNQYAAVLTTNEDALDGQNLNSARRISAAHLPWTEANERWQFSGEFGPDGKLVCTVSLAHDSQQANPFLHTYHPDHDNRTVSLGAAKQGEESYLIVRHIKLTFDPPGSDFDAQTSGARQLAGLYEETIQIYGKQIDLNGSSTDLANFEKKQYEVRGAFVLNRISEIGNLTTSQ